MTIVKRYTTSAAAALTFSHPHPERTARRSVSTSGLNFDVEFQVWPNRPAMAKSIRIQERAATPNPWRGNEK
jgi:hypothetical protein